MECPKCKTDLVRGSEQCHICDFKLSGKTDELKNLRTEEHGDRKTEKRKN